MPAINHTVRDNIVGGKGGGKGGGKDKDKGKDVAQGKGKGNGKGKADPLARDPALTVSPTDVAHIETRLQNTENAALSMYQVASPLLGFPFGDDGEEAAHVHDERTQLMSDLGKVLVSANQVRTLLALPHR